MQIMIDSPSSYTQTQTHAQFFVLTLYKIANKTPHCVRSYMLPFAVLFQYHEESVLTAIPYEH